MIHKKYLVPIKFMQVGSHTLVHLISPETLNLNFGFFNASLTERMNGATPEKIVSLNHWLEDDNTYPLNLNAIGKIFHVARCGSTLLCQNLKETSKFLVLGEPEFLGSLYSHDSIVPPHLRKKVAQKTLSCWNSWAQSQQKILIVKLSSYLTLHRKKILQDFPNSRVLFLYREPIAVLESLTRKPSSHIKKRKLINDIPEYPILITADPNLLCHYVGRVYFKLLDNMEVSIKEGYLAIDYTELAQKFNQIILFFSEQKNLEIKVEWKNSWNSKRGEWQKNEYKEVDAQKLDEFYENNKAIIYFLQKKYNQVNICNKIMRNKVNEQYSCFVDL